MTATTTLISRLLVRSCWAAEELHFRARMGKLSMKSCGTISRLVVPAEVALATSFHSQVGNRDSGCRHRLVKMEDEECPMSLGMLIHRPDITFLWMDKMLFSVGRV